ncbi:MAG: VOC family protein [Acidimicrobiales bacterium]
MPNTLIFVDLPSPDPEAAASFYTEVFGWEIEGRPSGVFHRVVPGGHFPLDDGTPSTVGNLHLGLVNTASAVPEPSDSPARGTAVAPGQSPRVYILVDDDDNQDRILDTAESLGATIVWRDHYWAEFNGFCGSFIDPWGVQIVLWTKGGDDPQIPDGFTRM